MEEGEESEKRRERETERGYHGSFIVRQEVLEVADSICLSSYLDVMRSQVLHCNS